MSPDSAKKKTPSPMDELHKIFKGWTSEYLNEEQATELANIVTYYAREHGKARFAQGLFFGVLAGIAFLAWAA
jgi:hypothetical protein